MFVLLLFSTIKNGYNRGMIGQRSPFLQFGFVLYHISEAEQLSKSVSFVLCEGVCVCTAAARVQE